MKQAGTFFGLSLETLRHRVLLLAKEYLSPKILEKNASVGELDEKPAPASRSRSMWRIAIGVAHQVEKRAPVHDGGVPVFG